MSRHAEQLEWISVDERMPDDEMTVLMNFEYADPWPGWHEYDSWYDVSGAPVSGVKHWADMPEGPKA